MVQESKQRDGEANARPLLKLLIELGPLVLFFLVYSRAGIYWATGTLMAATVLSLVLVGLVWRVALQTKRKSLRYKITDRTIDSHVRNLRAKFAAVGCGSLIETRAGVGYRIGECA